MVTGNEALEAWQAEATTGTGSTKLVDDLRASLARPLTNAQKIERAFRQATTEAERDEIRAIATEEMAFAGSKTDLVALLNATGSETYEQEMDRKSTEDRQLYELPIDPPAYEAPRLMEFLHGLDVRFQEGGMNRAEYRRRQEELTVQLDAAKERDAQARADYEAKKAGTFDYAARYGDAPTDGHGSHDGEARGVRAMFGATAGPILGRGIGAHVRSEGESKADTVAAIRQHGQPVGVILDSDFD